jgi:hypothetical protein
VNFVVNQSEIVHDKVREIVRIDVVDDKVHEVVYGRPRLDAEYGRREDAEQTAGSDF